MEHNFEYCLRTMLRSEGGYVNHPKDPGGQTNLGVTKKVYDEFYDTDADDDHDDDDQHDNNIACISGARNTT